MKRASIALAVIGAVCLLAAWFLAKGAAMSGMPSYLAGWLFWSALPFGALPVVMLIDLGGPGAGFALEPALRRLLVLTPVAALLIIPVLIHTQALFGWAASHGFDTPFGQIWMTQRAFIIRGIIYLILWATLGFAFYWPPIPSAVERRRAIAAVGLFVYALTITLAAADWAMSVSPKWFSAEFGLLFAASQVAIAVSAAVLLAGPVWRAAEPEAAASFLLGASAIWGFAQFIQFLVIWSGNLPSEIGWYQDRGGPGGIIVVWVAFLAGMVAPVFMLLSWHLRRHPVILPVSAVLSLVGQLLGMLWLITPSFRHGFTITGMDGLVVLGLGAISIGFCLLPGPLPKPAIEAPQHAWR